MNHVSRYFSELAGATAQAWNRFWFTPSDPLPLCVVRIGVGACLCLYLAQLTGDLSLWFGKSGLIPPELFGPLVIGDSPVHPFAYWSVFHRFTAPWQAQAFHAAALLVAVLFTAGVYARATAVLSLLALLQYIHAAPFITGQVEPVLSMLLFYLCLGPCGAKLSFDAWLRTKRMPAAADQCAPPSWTATVSLRLIQVHLAMFYLMMGTAKLHGDIWWRGEGVWALMAMARSRLVDWTSIRNWGYFLNFWSHLIVWYELAFAVLIWNRWLRPLVIGLGIVLWLALIPVGGLVTFCLLMIVALAAYIPADFWHRQSTTLPAG
jgi:hypothetical protein